MIHANRVASVLFDEPPGRKRRCRQSGLVEVRFDLDRQATRKHRAGSGTGSRHVATSMPTAAVVHSAGERRLRGGSSGRRSPGGVFLNKKPPRPTRGLDRSPRRREGERGISWIAKSLGLRGWARLNPPFAALEGALPFGCAGSTVGARRAVGCIDAGAPHVSGLGLPGSD